MAPVTAPKFGAPPNDKAIGSDVFAYACREYLHSNSVLDIKKGLQLAIKLLDVLQNDVSKNTTPDEPKPVEPAKTEPIKPAIEPRGVLPKPTPIDDDDDDAPVSATPKRNEGISDAFVERLKKNGKYVCNKCNSFSTESSTGMKKHYNRCTVDDDE